MSTNADSTVIDTDVLVVGAGPAGLTTTALLARAGANAITVTKHSGTAHTPRAHITNQRAMEIFRDLGIEEQVRAASIPNEHMGDNVWALSFAGREIARRKSWGTGTDRRSDYDTASPTSMCNIGQHKLEPLLLDAAKGFGADLRFDTELIEIRQDDDAVYGTVKHRKTGETYTIRAKYAVGTDGGRSLVAEQAGIEAEGETGLGYAVNVWLEADLTKYRAHRPGALFFCIQPGRDFWLGSATFISVEPWTEWVMIVMYNPAVEQIDLSEEAMLERAHRAIGDDSVEVKIKNISQWQINHVLATTYRKGRILIAGDAAHRHPPANGLGSNTSVQDGANLAWKLAMVTQGHASDGLLDSYDAERRPVGRQVIDRAMDSVGLLGKLPGALGIHADQTNEEGQQALRDYFSDCPEGDAARQAASAVLDENDYQFNCHGVELGQRYQSSAVVPDGTKAPAYTRDPELYYHPTTFPGAYLPHVWLQHDGKPASTVDIAGHGGFTLFSGVGGDEWTKAAEQVFAQLGVPITCVRVGPSLEYDDVLGDWQRIREIGDHGALLVRPDRYIAARFHGPEGDSTATLRAAMESVLGLTASVG